jgi:hypothetical protein
MILLTALLLSGGLQGSKLNAHSLVMSVAWDRQDNRNEVECTHDTSFGPAMQIRGYWLMSETDGVVKKEKMGEAWKLRWNRAPKTLWPGRV